MTEDGEIVSVDSPKQSANAKKVDVNKGILESVDVMLDEENKND